MLKLFSVVIVSLKIFVNCLKNIGPNANALANFPAVEEVPVVLFINFPLCCGSPLTK